MVISLSIPVSISNLDFLVKVKDGPKHIDLGDGKLPLEVSPRNARKFVSALIDGGHIIKYTHNVFKVVRM